MSDVSLADRRDAPPVYLLGLGAGVAAVSAALLLMGTQLAHWAGYLLGTLCTIVLVALYRRGDRRQSSSPYYSPRPELDKVAALVLLVGVCSAVLHIYYIAHEWAR